MILIQNIPDFENIRRKRKVVVVVVVMMMMLIMMKSARFKVGWLELSPFIARVPSSNRSRVQIFVWILSFSPALISIYRFLHHHLFHSHSSSLSSCQPAHLSITDLILDSAIGRIRVKMYYSLRRKRWRKWRIWTRWKRNRKMRRNKRRKRRREEEEFYSNNWSSSIVYMDFRAWEHQR